MGVFDEVIEEAKANTLPLVTSPWTEGLDGVPDQNFVRNGIDIGVLKDIVLLPSILEKAEDSLALVKKGNKKVKTSAGGNLIDPKQCDSVAFIAEDASQISDGVAQLLMLILMKATEVDVSREHDVLAKKRDIDFSFNHKIETRREIDTMRVPHDRILNIRTLIA